MGLADMLRDPLFDLVHPLQGPVLLGGVRGFFEADPSVLEEPPQGGDVPPGRNAERDFHGEKRANESHESTTDPDARLYRKGNGRLQPNPIAQAAGGADMTTPAIRPDHLSPVIAPDNVPQRRIQKRKISAKTAAAHVNKNTLAHFSAAC